MAVQIKKAKRSAAKIKIGMSGISGSGKTMSSLLIGYGLLKSEHPNMSDADIWEKILVIDTENRSSTLYVGSHVGSTVIGEFLTIEISAPFTVQKYIEAIDASQEAGVEFLIIDSMTHVWNAEGSLLEMQNNVTKRTGNSYTAWREITPLFNQLMNKILQCDMHVVTTYRGKKEYAIEEDGGRKKVVAKGVGANFRSDTEFEMSIYFDIDQSHIANAEKDRTGLFDGRYFVITAETGKEIYNWLSTSSVEPPKVVKTVAAAETEQETAQSDEDAKALERAIGMVDKLIKEKIGSLSAEDRKPYVDKIESICGTKNYKKVTDINVVRELYKAFKEE